MRAFLSLDFSLPLGKGLFLGIVTDFMELLFWGRLDSEHHIFQYLVLLLEWEISQQREEA